MQRICDSMNDTTHQNTINLIDHFLSVYQSSIKNMKSPLSQNDNGIKKDIFFPWIDKTRLNVKNETYFYFYCYRMFMCQIVQFGLFVVIIFFNSTNILSYIFWYPVFNLFGINIMRDCTLMHDNNNTLKIRKRTTSGKYIYVFTYTLFNRYMYNNKQYKCLLGICCSIYYPAIWINIMPTI